MLAVWLHDLRQYVIFGFERCEIAQVCRPLCTVYMCVIGVPHIMHIIYVCHRCTTHYAQYICALIGVPHIIHSIYVRHRCATHYAQYICVS